MLAEAAVAAVDTDTVAVPAGLPSERVVIVVEGDKTTVVEDGTSFCASTYTSMPYASPPSAFLRCYSAFERFR